MIDERLKTREESGSTSSPTKRHPEHREGSIMHLSTLSLSKGLLLISFLFLAACTDYVQKMDDDFNEWEQAQQQAELSSSSQVVKSSSSVKSSTSSSSVFLSGDSREKSSNSTEQKSSSSSNNKASSSSAKSSSSNKVSSSSEQKSKSSSSVKTSSSSEKEISSSETRVSPCKKDEEDKCEYGTLIDSRDGKKYKTVTIGTQIWMAENLNYASENSFCYKGLAENCIKYGRLYSWATSMDSAHVWSSNGQNCGYKTTCSPTYPVQGICPTDWHLPNFAEWNTLLNSIGGNANAGKMLKSTSGWKILSNWYEGGNGTNAYGFSALPAGSKFSKEGYNDEGSNARFWSSTEYDDEKYRSNDAYYLELNYLLDKAKLTNSEKKFGHSVRCIKNKFTTNSIKSSSSIAESNSSGKPSSSSKMSELISSVSSANSKT